MNSDHELQLWWFVSGFDADLRFSVALPVTQGIVSYTTIIYKLQKL